MFRKSALALSGVGAAFTVRTTIIHAADGNTTNDWSSNVSLPPGEYVRRLFDGKTLEGWNGNIGRHWNAMDNGVIVGSSHGGRPNGAPRASTYLMTSTKHRHFRLLFEAKIEGDSDVHTGVAILGKRYVFKNEENSYQGHLVMIQKGDTNKSDSNSDWGLFELMRRNWQTGSVSGNWCPNGGRANEQLAGVAAEKSQSQEGWHRCEVLVKDNRILIGVNGLPLLDYVDPNPELLAAGPIGLQLHWLSQDDVRCQKVMFRGLLLVENPELEELVTVKKENGKRKLVLKNEGEQAWVKEWRRKNMPCST